MSPGKPLSNEQWDLIGTLDDVSEHVFYELDLDDYRGPSTCGMASIKGIDGRSKLVRRAKSVADLRNRHVEHDGDGFQLTIGGLEMILKPGHESGYWLSVSNLPEITQSPDYQRLDLQERVHRLVLERFQYNGYLADAYVSSRID